ncbi:long-chain fatty acid--CoA ligase [Chromobacterium haemolyticum]|uniref:Long-chain fatty acid--CoA ligase n=1 Tax=Chromobacterium fluminis TaxID=3044269 RepID=A0ABX0L7Y2_9NEIS|nr:AMP-binding protein [Chromobacterium haemolyticum]NHR07103.1 long-chain fatty acid--CoA ligase [Chromobacterium haemolyticum]
MLTHFDELAAARPQRTLLRYQGCAFSYGAVSAASRRAAAVLRAHGVARGDRVALMCFNTPAFVEMLLGAWRLGAAVVPVNHKLQAEEVDYILAHCDAALSVFDGELAPVWRRVRHRAPALSTGLVLAGWPDFDAEAAAADGFEGETPAPEGLAEVLYTSGTTGRPKGCMLSHRGVRRAAEAARAGLGLDGDEVFLLAMPIWHASPLNNWLAGTLLAGGTVALLREYRPLDFLETVARERVTAYFGAPVSYLLPLQTVPDFERFDLSSVRTWIYGGGPIGADTARRLMTAYRSNNFYQVYGMTETGPAGSVLRPDEQLAKAGSIGRCGLPGVELRLVRAGRDCRAGEVGEIWLRADSLMQGYLNDEAATRQALAGDGWYRSGDLARRDADGYCFIVDRIKDMIVSGGENVYSKEVEDVLLGHPAVADAAVIGEPHPDWGETVVAYVVAQPGEPPSGEALADYLASRLARYKIPRRFHFVERLPRTPTGKLQKYLLRREAPGGKGA